MWCGAVSGSGRSELDELQEEVVRRARQQEQQRRREAEREAAMGFNPKPSKYMDLDQLQHQGTEHSGAEGGQYLLLNTEDVVLHFRGKE